MAIGVNPPTGLSTSSMALGIQMVDQKNVTLDLAPSFLVAVSCHVGGGGLLLKIWVASRRATADRLESLAVLMKTHDSLAENSARRSICI